jgi:hypothetical protein
MCLISVFHIPNISTVMMVRHLFSTLILLLVVQLASAQFTLVGPPDSTLLDFNSGMPTDTATITWTALDGATGYNFHLDLPTGDFSAPAFTSPTVTDSVLKVTFAYVDSVLGALQIGSGDTVDLIWTVTAETDTGTTFADTIYQISFVRFMATSIAGPLTGSSLSLYPNPTESNLRINLTNLRTEAKQLSARINDLAGRVIWQADYQAAGTQFQQDIVLPQVAPGMYFFTLTADGQAVSQPLQIK